MKKLFYLGLFLIISCSNIKENKTVEERIEEKFKTFVAINFDDPSSFKEIIKIKTKDSLNNEIVDSIFAMNLDIYNSLHKVDSIYSLEFNKFLENADNRVNIEGQARLSEYKKEQIRTEAIELVLNNLSLNGVISEQKELLLAKKAVVDSLYLNIDSINVFCYIINTRIETDGKLKKQDFYALVENDSITIFEQQPIFINYSKNSELLMTELRDFTDMLENLGDLLDEKNNNNEKFVNLFISNGLLK